MTAWELALTCGLPTALTGFFVWLLKRHIDKRDTARQVQEKKREDFEYMLLKSTTASIALGEATAKAVQRIPDAHCNGDMHAALDYAQKIKHEQRDFLEREGIEHITGGQ